MFKHFVLSLVLIVFSFAPEVDEANSNTVFFEEDVSTVFLDLVEVIPEEYSNSLIERTYYESGRIKSMINYGVDSYDYSYIDYHENREIARTGKQGDGCAIGTTYEWV